MENIVEKVYRNGFMQELIGKTNVAIQAYASGFMVIILLCTRIDNTITTNQQQKSGDGGIEKSHPCKLG